jgi:hypothetical protein
MKVIVITTLAAVATIAAAATGVAANQGVSSGSQGAAPLSLDQKATSACFSAFIAKMIPGSAVRARSAMPADGTSIFSSVGGSLLAPYKIMEVEMTVNSVSNNALLATSVCTVNRDAKVLRLSTRLTDAAKLTGFTLKDIKLTMTKH